jgi:hypothetical protein
LASYCDGANSLDGQGFNKFDAPTGHRLAKMLVSQYSETDIRKMKQLVEKYKKQLGE